jgi:hypothetical protein
VGRVEPGLERDGKRGQDKTDCKKLEHGIIEPVIGTLCGAQASLGTACWGWAQ